MHVLTVDFLNDEHADLGLDLIHGDYFKEIAHVERSLQTVNFYASEVTLNKVMPDLDRESIAYAVANMGNEPEALDPIYEFVFKKMRLSSYYQPAILRSLLRCGGIATSEDLARDIMRIAVPVSHGKNAVTLLRHQEKGIAHIKKLIQNYPAKVLGKHGIVEVIKGHNGVSVWTICAEIYGSEFDVLEEILTDKLREYLGRGVKND